MGAQVESDLKRVKFQLKRYDHNANFAIGEECERPVRTPSEYFSYLYPELVEQWGTPFLEASYVSDSGDQRVKPLAMNQEFFASLLGGPKGYGHEVVWYEPDKKFYFLEPQQGVFFPTTENKMEVLLSQQLLKCAEAVQYLVDFEFIFLRLRSSEQIQAVVERAKSILSCDRSFFEGADGHKRLVDGEIIDPAYFKAHELFLRSQVVRANQILWHRDLKNAFADHCEALNMPLPTRKQVLAKLVALVSEHFGIALRRDLKNSNGKHNAGWMGLALREQLKMAPIDVNEERDLEIDGDEELQGEDDAVVEMVGC